MLESVDANRPREHTMPSRKLDLSAEEIARPFHGPLADQFPVILTKPQAAALLATNVKTLSV